jgi:hypothetical protein
MPILQKTGIVLKTKSIVNFYGNSFFGGDLKKAKKGDFVLSRFAFF